MITVQDLYGNAKMRMVMALDMEHGQYQNSYRSESYPRLEVVKGGNLEGREIKHWTTYFVDGTEVADLEAAVAMLNTARIER